ncbi:hypothetical protein BO99DRAFT_5075 [Aspergillus violaceofuscus CBS 115571]|uniref:Uncharacterized protein n=1 Tax=Aspergillus violaceofuscus (strain CBS 115571) TaxID=1450538 RepID=A0A2V5HQB0_ASPV1|nr:hypothetical protein BO99DRAFT_5075 [Aspergillus violaceofuscus CBS 115571]
MIRTHRTQSDEAIEECLDGLKVEVWNWKKIDLCTDVIAKEALETAREVSLYSSDSSGNNAVLLGWSSADGLARFPNLEKVHLYVREGLESPTRLEEYMKLFEHRLKQGKPDRPKLEFNWTTDSTNESYASTIDHSAVHSGSSC